MSDPRRHLGRCPALRPRRVPCRARVMNPELWPHARGPVDGNRSGGRCACSTLILHDVTLLALHCFLLQIPCPIALNYAQWAFKFSSFKLSQIAARRCLTASPPAMVRTKRSRGRHSPRPRPSPLRHHHPWRQRLRRRHRRPRSCRPRRRFQPPQWPPVTRQRAARSTDSNLTPCVL